MILAGMIKMNMKDAIILLSALSLALLCIGCVCAAQQADNLTVDDADEALEVDITGNDLKGNSTGENGNPQDVSNSTKNTTTQKQKTQTKQIEPEILCDQGFIHKKSNTYKVKLFTYNGKNKLTYPKNVKLVVKVKIGKKTKVFNVKTNKKGEAKILNVKKLKIGKYRVTIKSNDPKYKVNAKGTIVIYGKAKKKCTIVLKKGKYGIEGRKKLKKGDYIYSFYEPKDMQNPKGVYAQSSNTKGLDTFPYSKIIKAKFTFKNKKTGKIIKKTSKLTKDKFYGWKTVMVKPIKGYTPVKTEVWYLTR